MSHNKRMAAGVKGKAAALPADRLEVFHRLHPGGRAFGYQEAWVKDRSRYKLGVKARQIGITTSEAIRVFLEALLWQPSAEAPDPPVVAFSSPSARQSSRLMHYIQRARSRFEQAYQTRVVFKKEREDWVLMDNLSEIWSLPNNPRTIEGLDLNQGVIDELGNFEGREDREVYESMTASLAAKGGRLVLFGKPRGRRGLFWDLWNPYGEFSGQFSRHEFPYTVRAEVDPTYRQAVEEHRKRLTAIAFKENYECAFIDEGVVVFPWDLLDRQTQPVEQWFLHKDFQTSYPCYMGIDFGKKVSKTAISVIEQAETKVYLRFQETVEGAFDIQRKRIFEAIEHFKPEKIKPDKTGIGLPLVDDLEAQFPGRVEGVQFNPASKEKMVLGCRNLFEEGRLVIPDLKEFKDQLHGIEKEVLDSGRSKYTGKRADTDWLDDRAWSFFLACSCLGEGTWGMSVVQGPIRPSYSQREKFIKDLEDE